MKISVIIPTFKRPDMLQRAIASVLNQTHQNFEILIVDDNDPQSIYRKETEKFMKQYINEKRIKYIKRAKNGGGCVARNTGIENAKADFIAFLDDDDEFKPNNLEKQLNNLQQNNLDVSVCESISVDETGKIVSRKEYCDFDNYNDIMIYHIVRMLVGTQTFFIKREWLNKVNGFSEIPSGHEFVLMYKLIEKGARVGVVEEPLLKINIHSQERITASEKKIAGEKNIFHLKKKYFRKLTLQQRQLVRYRYYSILFETYWLLGKKSLFFYYFVLAFLIRPLFMTRRLFKRIRRGK